MAIAHHHRPSRTFARVGARAIAVAGFLGMMQASAWANGTIIDSAGFESPTYAIGALQGQHSWVTGGGHASTATVESTVATPSSTQAVQVNRGANSDDYWYIHELGFPTQRFVTIDWDMRVNQSITGAFGPFFGIRSFDDQDGGTLVPGTLGVDASTGDILYETGNQLTETGTLASFNAWHHYRLVLDFTSKNYQAFYDGSHLVTTAFADSGANHFSDADIAAIAAGGDSLSASAVGTAYFDNYLVRDGLSGDYDQSGTVDAADYTVWKQTFGNTLATAGIGADGNGDSNVDAADFVVWRQQLGASLFSGSGSGALSNGAVPEPSTLILLLCGLVMSSLGMRHRHDVGV